MNTWNALRPARAGLRGLTFLCLLALVASCDTDANGPLDEAIALLSVGGAVGAQFQNLSITREGAAVTDATVTVNGVLIPHAGAGDYQGELPAAVPAGSALNLRVSAGDATVQGTVNVPEAPVLTDPATGCDIPTVGSMHVGWTSATNPDRFVVSASWVSRIFGGVRIDRTFSASGSARELEITGIEAGTDITISVVAYKDGSLTGQVDRISRLSAGSESSRNAGITTDSVPLRISGGVGAQSQNIWIFQGSWDLTDGVTDAVVTVNGVTIPGTAFPYYHGELPAAVPVGAPLHLRVSARGLIVEATGNVPEAPVVTALAAGAVFAPGGSITVRWGSETDPDRFSVYVNKEGGYVWHRELPGTTREIEIAASELPRGLALRISVVAYNDGSFSGPAHPDSRMGIMSVGQLGLVIMVDPSG